MLQKSYKRGLTVTKVYRYLQIVTRCYKGSVRGVKHRNIELGNLGKYYEILAVTCQEATRIFPKVTPSILPIDIYRDISHYHYYI